LVTAALLSLGLFQQSTRDRSAGRSVLTGAVILNGQRGNPVPYASVILTDSSGNLLETTADENGLFRFVGVEPGRYFLTASKPSFLKGSYGASLPERMGIPIAVSESSALSELLIPLWRGGVIAGAIRNWRGEPVQDLTVAAFRVRSVAGDPTVSSAATASVKTDDLGTYRLFGLAPGKYVVAAILPPALVRAALEAKTQERTDLRTAELPTSSVSVFFPGTSAIGRADLIELGTSEELGGVSFSIVLEQMARVEVLVTPPPGVEIATLRLRATMTTDVGSERVILRRELPSSAHGAIEIADVPPGDYRLTVSATERESEGRRRQWTGLSSLSVAGSEVKAAVALEPAPVVRGRIALAGALDSPPGRIELRLVPAGAPSAAVITTEVTGGSSFVLTAPVAGRYVLAATTATSSSSSTVSWEFESATLSGIDVADQPFEVRPGQVINDVIVKLTDRQSEVVGRVIGERGLVVSGHFLVAFPLEATYWTTWTRRVRQTRVATDGSFRIEGLPPGDYGLVALTDLRPDEWLDPEFIGQLRSISTVRFSLTAGESKRQDVRIAARKLN
jgi:uncharacterized protein (DUF2141 family)